MTETRFSRLRRQWSEATMVKNFPVGSWLLAGSCLCGLALLERFVTGPMRKEQEAAGAAPSVSIFGDIAVSKPRVGQKTLPDGSKLMEDGSIRRKGTD